jgi:prepilin-type N-terminal cleavage/methylation domain-containing protein
MRSEKGFTLLEVVIAIALMGIVGVAIFGGLSNASKAIFIADERATAESIARTQMEYIKRLPYSGNYTADSASIPAGFTVTTNVATLSDNQTARTGIQKIVVTVYHHVGGEDKPIFTTNNSTLEDYKVQ